MHLMCSHNYALVALSVLIAMFTSYTALALAGRVTAASGWTRAIWLLGGAVAMGTGIWSMHYIGMLAFILPVPVAYHWPTVLLSLMPAILASAIALYVVSRQKMGASQALIGSVLMGAGIASMHYVGMAAMRLPAICHYDSFLVVLSVVFAVLISLAALWITFRFRDENVRIGWRKITGAVVLGAAIPVMHYTGMAAASFMSSSLPVDLSHAVSISTLGTVGIAGATLIVLGLALVMSWADRRFTAQALELQGKKLQQSEAYLSEAQRLSRTGSFGWKTSSGEIVWSEETFRIFEVDRATKPTLELILQRVHPDDVPLVQATVARALQDRQDFDFEHRILMNHGSVKHLRIVAHAERDNSSELKFVGAVMDITERKRAEEALRASEQVARGQVEALTYSLDVLATAPEPEKFIGQMLSSIGRLFDAQSLALWLLDETGDSVVLRAWAEGQNFRKVDADHPFMKNPLLWKDDPGLQEAFLCGAPVACEDVEHDRHISEALRQYFLSRGTKKFLRIPTLVGGKVKGFIGIRHEARTPYRPEEIELAQALAHQVMLAIQLTELAEQSRKTAILAERNRMARDIHDTLAQGFIGVILQLDAVADAICRSERKEAENYLQRASELARRSLNEARRSVHALRPEALEHANFWDALKGIIKNTTAASPIHTKAKLRGKLPILPIEWQENLMHIGQEALTNTLKYAHADNFETQLTCDAKELRLEFKDDGDGFKLDDQHDGFGLVGMRERVQQMGGELRIATERSKGTTVTVLLPNSMS